MFKSFDKIYHATQWALVAGSLWFWRPENWSPTLKMLCACVVFWTSPNPVGDQLPWNWKAKGWITIPSVIVQCGMTHWTNLDVLRTAYYLSWTWSGFKFCWTLILCLSLENLANPSELPFKSFLVIIAISDHTEVKMTWCMKYTQTCACTQLTF